MAFERSSHGGEQSITASTPAQVVTRGPVRKPAADFGDDGTNDLLVSDVVRTNEKQAWFIGQLTTVNGSNEQGR